jgi:DNA-directed RNA polymerase subunit F
LQHKFGKSCDRTTRVAMELVEKSSELISNREVLNILKNYTSKKQTNLATILYETTSYLETTPAATYTTPKLAEFLDQIKKYDLTRLEKVQLTNLKPQNETELHLIIDNIEDRFDDSQRVDLLKLVESSLCQVDTNKKAKVL